MHETHLLKNILLYLEKEEKDSRRKISKIRVSLSEFGGLSKEHFLEHYKNETLGTRWEDLGIEFNFVPVGPELEITKIYYA